MAKSKAFGAKFQYFNVTWIDLSQVESVGDFSIVRETIDTTTHDSTGGYRELIGHLRRLEPFDVRFLFDPVDAGHIVLQTRAHSTGADAGEAYRIVFADSGTTDWEATCIVTGFSVNEQAVDGKLVATANFQPVGAPDFAPV